MSLENKINSLEGWCSIEKATILSNLTKQIENENGVCTGLEIGVYGARSLVALGWELHQPSHIFGIDPYSSQASTEYEINTINRDWWSNIDYNKIKNGAFDGIKDKRDVISILVMKSNEANKLFNDNLFDVIHQDGNHSDEIACMEVDMWHNKVKKGGYWIMDDIDWNVSMNNLQTVQAYSKLLEKGFIEIGNYKKWAIFRKL